MLLYVAAPMCWNFFFNITGKYTLQEDYIWIGRKQGYLIIVQPLAHLHNYSVGVPMI